MTREPISVLPAVHYKTGGVPTNLHGEVGIKRQGDPEAIVSGLIGEAAYVSVRGVNRLGSNSLLDTIVFGRTAALRVTESRHRGESHPPLPDAASERAIARLDRIRWSKSKSGADAINAADHAALLARCSAPARCSMKARTSSTSSSR